MPFKKMKNGKYKSPTGKEMTEAQVKAYYAKKGGSNRKKKKYPKYE